MKLSEMKNKLLEKESIKEVNERRISSLKEKFLKGNKEEGKENASKLLVSLNSVNLNSYSNDSNYNLDDLKIIGVSGSKGKSTVAKIIHEYLKSIGKKSILYSSVEIDSFASIKDKNVACERALASENTLLDIIEEAEAYESEYLILEVNDTAIYNGLVNDIPFDVKVLTNIHKKNSNEFFDENEYFNLKKSFITDVDKNKNCKCVLSLSDQYTIQEYNDLIRACKGEAITCGTKYLCEVFKVDNSNLDYMLFSGEGSRLNSLKGIKFNVRCNNQIYEINSKLIFSFSALNILNAISVLDTLKVFDVDKFNNLLEKIVVDGRDELIYANGRYILIGISLMPHLELLNTMKINNEFKKLKLLTASIGEGFITWDKSFTSEKRLSKIHDIRKEAMNYVDKYSDFTVLTTNDPGSSNKNDILNELISYFDDTSNISVIPDRIEAIKHIIKESEIGDLIYISGRGNRNVFCNTYEEMQIYTDKEIVMKEIKNKGWI